MIPLKLRHHGSKSAKLSLAPLKLTGFPPGSKQSSSLTPGPNYMPGSISGPISGPGGMQRPQQGPQSGPYLAGQPPKMLAQTQYATQTLPRQRSGAPATSRPMGPQDPRRAVVDHIIRDCYSKLVVVDGRKVPENKYNTHFAVREYALFPQLAPPPGLSPAQLGTVKSRILVVCTKHTGRVLLQKGKYNDQKHVYQIGRTWDLDELTCVTRAAPDAVILLLNKDYYWQSGDDPDRLQKFVHHLAVIHHRFTGHYPNMKGFTLESLGLPSEQPMSTYPPRQTAPQAKLASATAVKSPADLYNNMDFTANGTLPMKPMQVMDVDRPSPGNGGLYAAAISTPRSAESFMSYSSKDIGSVSTRESPSKQTRESPKKKETVPVTPSTEESQSLLSGSNETFEDSRSTMPTILEYAQKNGLLLPLRNYNPEREHANLRDISDSFEAAASYGLQLLSQLEYSDLNEAQSERHVEVIASGAPEIDDKDAYSIEEASLTDSSIDTQVHASEEVREKNGGRNDSVIDNSIKDIEDFMATQFGNDLNFSESDKVKDSVLTETRLHSEAFTENLPKAPAMEDKMHVSGPIFQETKLSIEPTGKDDEPQDLENFLNEKSDETLNIDPEIEELLDGIGWHPTDGSEHCVKMLRRELASVKHKNIKELTTLDFGKDTLANEVKVSAAEILNLVEIFEKMEVSFKMIAPEINKIEYNSKGLQTEAVNKKILYNELNEIMSKVNLTDHDLNSVANYKEFDDTSMIRVLEEKLLLLYDAMRAFGKNTSTEDLSKMRALKKFHGKYETVCLSFIQQYLKFIGEEFEHIIEGFSKDVSSISPNKILPDLRKIYAFAGVNLFVKCISERHFIIINDQFNSYMASFLNNMLNSRSTAIHSVTDSARNSRLTNNSELLSGLKRNKSSRFGSARLIGRNSSLNGDQKLKRNESISRNSEGVNDPKIILRLVKETTQFMLAIQYFLGIFFHLTSEEEFSAFLTPDSIQKRMELYENESPDSIDYKTNSNDLLRNMNAIFGNYINRFTREFAPSDLVITQVMVGLFELLADAESRNQDFIAYSFLSKLSEKYKSNWDRFIAQQVDMFNKSDVRAKGEILPVIQNLNQIITHTESSLQDAQNSRQDLPQMSTIMGQTYDLLTRAAIDLFSRVDPLLKSNTHDEKERAHRNVAILQNIFSILQQLGEYDSPLSKRMSSALDTTFETVEKEYFDYIIRMYVGKISEFVNAYKNGEPKNKSKREDKILVRGINSSHTAREMSTKISEMLRKMEKHVLTSDTVFEHDLLDVLWNNLEKVVESVFLEFHSIAKTIDRDIEESVSAGEIRRLFNKERLLKK